MNIPEFQSYIEEKIPLVAKGGFKILELSPEKVVVRGGFQENRNHHGTVFGGSMSVILTLASWALVQEIMNREDPGARIVIARQTVDYLKPATGDFTGECTAPDEQELQRFLDSCRQTGVGRIMIEAGLIQDGRVCARFTGEFHVTGSEREQSKGETGL